MRMSVATATILASLIAGASSLVTALLTRSPDSKIDGIGHIVSPHGKIEIEEYNINKNGKLEESLDPRKELNNMGIGWNYENFWRSIAEHDSRSIVLFLEGGMKLRRDRFWLYIYDYFSEDSSKIIMDYAGVDVSSGCFSGIDSIPAVLRHKQYPDKIKFISRFCSSEQSELQISHFIEENSKKLNQAIQHNDEIPGNISLCIKRIKETSARDWVDKAIDFDMLNIGTIRTAEDQMLSTMKIDIVFGRHYDPSLDSYMEKTTQEACQHEYAEQDVAGIRALINQGREVQSLIN